MNIFNLIKNENTIILIKTISYKIVSSTMTFTVAWVATGSITTGGIIAIARGLLGMVWYATHEKIWFFIEKKRPKN